MKEGEDPERPSDGGDPACWLHEFEEELLGDPPEREEDADDE